MNTQIIRASSDQLDAVLTLVDRLLAELFDGPGDYVRIERDVMKNRLLEAGDRFTAFLALDDRDTPIGVATLTEGVAVYAGGRYGVVSELYVDPAHRSTGIGRQLLTTALDEAMARRWARVEVTAPPDARWGRTLAFYQRNGFVFTGPKLKYLVATSRHVGGK